MVARTPPSPRAVVGRRPGVSIGIAVLLLVAGVTGGATPAEAWTQVESCAWNSDPTYKSDLHNTIWSSGGYKWGYGETWGHTVYNGCLTYINGYKVGVAAAQYDWVTGTPYVCDLGTQGYVVVSYTGYRAFETACSDNGHTHTSSTTHHFWISGVQVSTGLVYATE